MNFLAHSVRSCSCYSFTKAVFKSVFLVFAVFTNAGLVTEAAANNCAGPVHVYLLAGQSNMVGFGPVTDAFVRSEFVDSISLDTLIAVNEEDASIALARADVWYSDGDSPATALMPGFGNGTVGSHFGPELGIGTRLGEELETDVVLFKSATGSTTLGFNWRPPSASGNTGTLYSNMVQDFTDFLDSDIAAIPAVASCGYVVAGFVWLQGWSDWYNAGYMSEYEDNLVYLVNDLRGDLQIPLLPAIVVEGPAVNAQHQQQINAARLGAIATINASNADSATFVGTQDLYDYTIGGHVHYHWSARNYLEVGRRAGQQIIASGSVATSRCYSDVTPSTETNQFTDHSDGTITDDRTGLMWSTCSDGQTWSGGACTGVETKLSWDLALNTPDSRNALNYLGYANWRLPNKNELASLIELACVNPAINPTLFPQTPNGGYWTSTPAFDDAQSAWRVAFNYGTIEPAARTNKYALRLVRNP